MKKLCILVISFLFIFQLRADEGMWIPLFLQKNEADMQRMGMKISATDIYSINQNSLKDAIVQFGGGCTAEFISDKGLIFTNHHCGYSQIVEHSTVEHDYLTNGFWAESMNKELPCPGLKVTLLVRMEDVTKQVMEGVTEKMTDDKRKAKMEENVKKIKANASKDNHYQIEVSSFYYGNQYFMFVNEVFKDVRLVGAPPSNIGKFGGDTDNWMWPRHTGDFSMFRVYASPDNKPADYSEKNVPYKPKKHLNISLKGFSEDDFTFIFGYPGRTQEYILSDAVDLTANTYNPARIALREKRLDIYNAAMKNSAEERLMYSSKVASVANFWKKMIGESKGIQQLDGVTKKRLFEQQFQNWANQNPERNKKYGTVQQELSNIYKQAKDIELSLLYYSEALRSSELMLNAEGLLKLDTLCNTAASKDDLIKAAASDFSNKMKTYFANKFTLRRPVDKSIFIETLRIYYTKIDKNLLPPAFQQIETQYKGNFDAFADAIFEKSFLTSPNAFNTILSDFNRNSWTKVAADPAYKLYKEIRTYINQNYPLERLQQLYSQANSLYKVYMQGMMEMQPNRNFYPDANSTLRISYGKVKGFFPTDGIEYKYYTTIEGIMQKENPDIYDYVVEKKLKTLYTQKDYGRYADKKGNMPVAFIATNHTTGGNSGSPVLNANGELIGINFDRCWESTMSDLMYDANLCRNIALDIRYCLFIIDKFAGAKHLVDEMTIVY